MELRQTVDSHSSYVPLVVPLTVAADQAVAKESEASSTLHFSLASEIPLSVFLPDFFFALCPWRRPEDTLRSDPLQIDMFFLVDSLTEGDPCFMGPRTHRMVCFMFHTFHDHVWDG